MTLQKAQINIKRSDSKLCLETLRLKVNRDQLQESQICAGDSEIKTDTCEGDSGGPLVQTLNGINTLMTSFGSSFCANNTRPGIYTRVSSFINWIEEKVQEDFSSLNLK